MTSPEHPPRYRVHPSPIGDILIVATADGIVTLHPFDGPLHGEIERVALQLREVPLPADETHATSSRSGRSSGAAAFDDVFDRAITQLEEYFDGDRERFDLELDWRLVRGFHRDALEAVRDIPYGETASYGEVAIAAGIPAPLVPWARRARRHPSRSSCRCTGWCAPTARSASTAGGPT